MVAVARIFAEPLLSLEKMEQRLKELDHKRDYERLLSIKLSLIGKEVQEIAEILGKNHQTIYNWIDRWNSLGIEGLKPRYKAGKARLTEEQFIGLKEIITSNKPRDVMVGCNEEYWNVELVRRYIFERFRVQYSYKRVWEFVRVKFGLSYVKPRSMDYRRPEDAKNLLKKKLEDISEVLDDPDTVLGFVDETAVQNKPYTARILSENSHLSVKTSYHPQQKLSCFGFLDLEGKLVPMLSKKSKKEDFLEFLKKLRSKYDKNNTIVIVLDNARIHHANIIKDFWNQNNIIPIHLPPYCPDLNPIETVWRILKRKISNQVYKNLDNLKNMVIELFDSFSNLKSLSRKWISTFLPSF